MKNLFRITVLPIAFLVANFTFAQNFEVSNNDLLAMADQTMNGQLTYLNYSDDSSSETLNCELTTSVEKGRLQIRVLFEEKNKKGKPYRHNSSLKISKDRKTLLMGKESWKVLKSKKESSIVTLVVYKKGRDNNRDADMQMTVILNSNGKISWKKEVRYEGAEKLFQRNLYSFSK